MKQKKLLPLLSLIAFLSLATGCSGTSSSISSSNSNTSAETSSTDSSSGDSSSVSSSVSDENEYDPDWQPGSDALEDATQPEVKNPQGTLNELGKMRASSSEAGLPQQGEANILVVPVQFALSDSSNADENDVITEENRQALSDAFFGESDSVSSYYYASSFGALTLSGVVTPTISLPSYFSTYALTAYAQGQEAAIETITDYVYTYLFEETETYYSHDFDADDDGKIDNIVIAYAWSEDSWIFNSDYDYIYEALFAEGTFYNPTSEVNTITWTTAKIDDVHTVNEYIREVGKVLGLSYYYDSYGTRAPLANTDIMDDGLTGDQNPFSKYQLGWIDPAIYTPDDLDSELTITIDADSPIILSYEEVDLFGEYLILDFVSASDDSVFTTSGIRVYEVDSRLAKEYNGYYFPYTYDGETDFTDGVYTYSYSNDSTNPLYYYGIDQSYPLVSLLDSDGNNRHNVDASIEFDDSDLFVAGDSFGTESIVEGFYEDFRFHGDSYNGPELGIIFTVDEVSDSSATITLRRAD